MSFCLRLWLVTLLAAALFWMFWPGLINPDITSVIVDGVTGNIGDWHSPAASLYVGLTYHLGMPQGLLLVQVVLASYCVVALISLCRQSFEQNRMLRALVGTVFAAYAVLLLVLCAAYAMKDMWIPLCLSAALLVVATSRGAAWASCVAIGLCAIAVLIRSVTIVPALPIVIAAIYSIETTTFKRFHRPASAALVVVVLLALPFLVKMLADARSEKPQLPLFVFDVVGMGMRSDNPVDFVSSRLGVEYSLEKLDECFTRYSPASSEAFFWGACATQFAPDVRERLAKTWVTTIASHPLEDLSHRLSFSRNLLAPVDVPMGGWVARPLFEDVGVNSPKWFGRLNVPPAVDITLTGEKPGIGRSYLLRVQRGFSALGLGQPFIWLAMALAAVGVAWSVRRGARFEMQAVAWAAAVSAVGNGLVFMAFSPHAGSRYLVWSLIGAVLALAISLLSLPKPESREAAGN